MSRYSVPLVSVRVVAMTDARLDSAYGAVEDGGVRGEEARASPQRPHFRALVQALALLCVVSAGVSMNARTAVAPRQLRACLEDGTPQQRENTPGHAGIPAAPRAACCPPPGRT